MFDVWHYTDTSLVTCQSGITRYFGVFFIFADRLKRKLISHLPIEESLGARWYLKCCSSFWRPCWSFELMLASPSDALTNYALDTHPLAKTRCSVLRLHSFGWKGHPSLLFRVLIASLSCSLMAIEVAVPLVTHFRNRISPVRKVLLFTVP